MNCLKIHTQFGRFIKRFNPRVIVDLISGDYIVYSGGDGYVLRGVGTGCLKVVRENLGVNSITRKIRKGKVLSATLDNARANQKPVFFWRKLNLFNSKYYPH